MPNDLNDPKDLKLSLPDDRDSVVEGELLFDQNEDQAQLELDGFDSLIDEMNIVETPFALLTKDTSGMTRVDLSRGGQRFLSTSAGNLLPSALGEQAVLGLMWLCKHRHNFSTPEVEFRLRDLVTHYMFRGRFTKARPPNSELMQSVEEQINRVAHARIYSDGWYDKELGKRTQINAAIIDYVQVLDEGGRNRPRRIKIRWGEKFYQSVTKNYTKRLDPGIFLRIKKPLDRRLYRWLDRQLALKDKQKFNSIQEFAKFKLAMTGQKIERGGRTASSYISKRLTDALERLNEIGFSVRMSIDRSHDDYSIEFERLADQGPNDVIESDPAADLVCLFRLKAHGLTTRPRRMAGKERALASEWISTYGAEQAEWMVARCIALQRERRAEGIQTFAGLERYAPEAEADFDRQQNLAAEKAEVVDEDAWEEYRFDLRRFAEAQLAPNVLEALRHEAEASVEGSTSKRPSDAFAQRALVKAAFWRLKSEAVDGMTREEFFRFKSSEAREAAILRRHGSAFFQT